MDDGQIFPNWFLVICVWVHPCDVVSLCVCEQNRPLCSSQMQLWMPIVFESDVSMHECRCAWVCRWCQHMQGCDQKTIKSMNPPTFAFLILVLKSCPEMTGFPWDVSRKWTEVYVMSPKWPSVCGGGRGGRVRGCSLITCLLSPSSISPIVPKEA